MRVVSRSFIVRLRRRVGASGQATASPLHEPKPVHGPDARFETVGRSIERRAAVTRRPKRTGMSGLRGQCPDALPYVHGKVREFQEVPVPHERPRARAH